MEKSDTNYTAKAFLRLNLASGNKKERIPMNTSYAQLMLKA